MKPIKEIIYLFPGLQWSITTVATSTKKRFVQI